MINTKNSANIETYIKNTLLQIPDPNNKNVMIYKYGHMSSVDIFDGIYQGSLTEQICSGGFDELDNIYTTISHPNKGYIKNELNFKDELLNLSKLQKYLYFYKSMKIFLQQNFIFTKNHIYELKYIIYITKLFSEVCFCYYKNNILHDIDINLKFKKIQNLYQQCMNLHIQNLSNIHKYNNENGTIYLKPFSWEYVLAKNLSVINFAFLTKMSNKYPDLFNKNILNKIISYKILLI